MADVVTFDPVALLIVEINNGSPATNELDATEIYSEWKDWLLADPANMGHPQAFTSIGGEPRTLTQSLGITRFLENGWRIRPAEYEHKLAISGNLFTREPGESIFVPTLGTFNVHTETVTSNVIDTVATGGSEPTDVAAAVWAHATGADLVAKMTMITKILRNRTETNPATGIMTVYDDDGTTPLLTANLYEDVAAATPYDGTAGSNRRNRLV